MNFHYLTGVALGILGGFLTQGGQLLEKKAVNQVRQDRPAKGFMRSLFRNPVWLVGFFVGLGLGTAAYMLAQSMIGPALVPGLMASGLRRSEAVRQVAASTGLDRRELYRPD